MFLHQCGDCGERWYIGNPRTCKCPDETPQRTEQEPVAWYDPSNGVVSTDRDCPLFTPLGQVWPLSLEREWVGLTYEEETELIRLAHNHAGIRFYIQAAEAKLKEKNT